MMLPDEQYSGRQQRERAFYDSFRTHHRVREVKFDYVFGPTPRPYNSYWCTYHEVFSRFRDSSQRLLDFGCGPGVAAIRYAKKGFTTYGFDISAANIANCRFLAEKYGLSDRTVFNSHSAEALPYHDGFFDIVAGLDILHHIDIPLAAREVRRVLKPGGVAIFRECIEAPIWDTIRNWPVVTSFYSKSASFDSHITEDERKINRADLAIITGIFPTYYARRFGIFSRLHRLVPDRKQKILGALQRFDYRLTKALPASARFGGELLLILENR